MVCVHTYRGMSLEVFSFFLFKLFILYWGKGYPLQYSGLENSVGCIVHGIRKSQT